jgi:drug/metabolite transporter (DMT)-like permease
MKVAGGRAAGALLIAVSAIAFGAMAIFGKIAYAEGVGLESLLFLRFALAGALLAAVMVATSTPWPQGRALLGLVLMGSVGYVSQAWCYFTSLKFASAGLTALLLYLFPAMVTVLHAVLERRMLSPLRAFAVLAALAGTALTVGGDAHGQAAGVFFGIAAAVIYSIYIIVGERVMVGVSAMAAACTVMLSAAVSTGAIAFASGFSAPATVAGWGAIGAIALVSTVIAIICFFAGLKRLGAPDASTLSTLEPVATIALAAAFIGETVSAMQLVGGAIILGAVVVLARYGRDSGGDSARDEKPA